MDFDLDGDGALAEAFDNLEDDYADDVVYVTGSDVEYGLFLERGTRKMQPYPWFKPAIREFKANPESFILDNTDFNSIDEIETTDDLVKSIAFALEVKMTDNVNAQDASADRSPGTHPDHPKRDIGNLSNSIQAIRIS